MRRRFSSATGSSIQSRAFRLELQAEKDSSEMPNWRRAEISRGNTVHFEGSYFKLPPRVPQTHCLSFCKGIIVYRKHELVVYFDGERTSFYLNPVDMPIILKNFFHIHKEDIGGLCARNIEHCLYELIGWALYLYTVSIVGLYTSSYQYTEVHKSSLFPWCQGLLLVDTFFPYFCLHCIIVW